MPKLASVKYTIPGSPRYQQNRPNLLYSCSRHNRQTESERGKPDRCDGGRRSSLASRSPSLAWKMRKNNAYHAGYHSAWAAIKGGIYEEKTILTHRQKGKAFSVNKQNVFWRERRECVWLASSCLRWINMFTFEICRFHNKSWKKPGYSFIVELNLLIKGHRPLKEESGFTIFCVIKANVFRSRE